MYFGTFLLLDGFWTWYKSILCVCFIDILFSVLMLPHQVTYFQPHYINHMNMPNIKTCPNTRCMPNECSAIAMLGHTMPLYAIQCQFVACVSVNEVVLCLKAFLWCTLCVGVFRDIYIYMVCAFLAHISVRSRYSFRVHFLKSAENISINHIIPNRFWF